MKKLKELPLNSLVIDLKSTFMGHPVVWVRSAIIHPEVLRIQPNNSVPLYSYYIVGRQGQFLVKNGRQTPDVLKRFIQKILEQGVQTDMNTRFLNAEDTSWAADHLNNEIREISTEIEFSKTIVKKSHSGNNYLDEYNPLPGTQAGFAAGLSEALSRSIRLPGELLQKTRFRISDAGHEEYEADFQTPVRIVNAQTYSTLPLLPSYQGSYPRSPIHQVFSESIKEGQYQPPKEETIESFLYVRHVEAGRSTLFLANHPGNLKPLIFVDEDALVSDTPIHTDTAGGKELQCYVLFPNDLPKISGEDEDLGAKNDAFSLSYTVSDSDQVTITEKLNGQVLRTLQNAPKNQAIQIDISNEQLLQMNMNQPNTIEIQADDGRGGVSYRRYTFRRTNAAPILSIANADLGAKSEPFSVSFSATDPENNPMSAKITLNDRLIQTYETLPSGEMQTCTLSKLDFVQLSNTEMHKIRIEAKDLNGATTIRTLTFTRIASKLRYKLIRETDQRAKQILVSPTWYIAEGAVAKVQVCNNALDESPSWETVTEAVKENRQHSFINQTKTAENWAVGVQITIERAEASETSWLAGFGGAYK